MSFRDKNPMLNWRHHLGRDAFDQDRHSPKDFRCIGPLFWVPARSVVHKSLIRWKVAFREVAFLGEMFFFKFCRSNINAMVNIQYGLYTLVRPEDRTRLVPCWKKAVRRADKKGGCLCGGDDGVLPRQSYKAPLAYRALFSEFWPLIDRCMSGSNFYQFP